MKFALKGLAQGLMHVHAMPTAQAFDNHVHVQIAKEETNNFYLANHTHPDRKTTKTPEQQRDDYYAAEARRKRRALRNMRNAGITPPEDAGEVEML